MYIHTHKFKLCQNRVGRGINNVRTKYTKRTELLKFKLLLTIARTVYLIILNINIYKRITKCVFNAT